MDERDPDGLTWLKVVESDELAEGRVKSVTCARRTFCLTRFEGEIGALDEALQRAQEYDGPSLVEIIADPELV